MLVVGPGLRCLRHRHSRDPARGLPSGRAGLTKVMSAGEGLTQPLFLYCGLTAHTKFVLIPVAHKLVSIGICHILENEFDFLHW